MTIGTTDIYYMYAMNYIYTIFIFVLLTKTSFLLNSSDRFSSFVYLLVFFNLAGLPLSPTFFFKNILFLQYSTISFSLLALFLVLNVVSLFFYQKILLFFLKKNNYHVFLSKSFMHASSGLYVFFCYYNALFLPFNTHIFLILAFT